MTILITAGPTREPIDPVRYITNRSSGKMGYALAEVASSQSHRVILISGPTAIDVPDGVDFIPVESAQVMYDTVQKWIAKADAAIFTAAVSDYRPAHYAEQKIKKTGIDDDTMTLTLVKNPDILGSARDVFHFQGTLIGFAAESQNLIENAKKKLVNKQCDCIVANDISDKTIGFDSSDNEISLVYPEKTVPIPRASKHELAHTILKKVLEIHQSKNPNSSQL